VTGEHTRKLAVLLHADIVSSTTLVRLDEMVAHERIRNVFRNFSEIIHQHDGIAHEIRGDALVAEFSKASDDVTAALSFQSTNITDNSRLPDDIRPVLRIGIAMGEVIIADNTVTGDGIVLAQRLEQLANPNGVCIQGAAYETLPKRLPFKYENLGEQELKGFDEPIKVYRVSQETVDITNGTQNAAGPGLEDKPSIAVLPLDNMSGDTEQEFFADGMSEDIITSLSRFSSLLVIARNSSFVYKGVAHDIKQIGSELGVRYLLEGSIRKSDTRVRITAQLIDASSGAHLWAQRYDRVLEDVFDLQDEITQTIVAEILPELETAERNRAHTKSFASLSSWENYQRGMWHGYKLNREDASGAEEFFQLVLADNPQYQPAMAGLAWITYLRILFNWGSDKTCRRQELVDIGLSYARNAVSADDKDALAQYAYGRLLALNGEFDESIDRLKHAIEINPNYALAYHGLGYTLALGGRPAEAIAQFDTALRLSPKDPYRFAFSTMRAYALLQMKEYEEAVAWGRRGMRENETSFWAYTHVSSALGHLGLIEEAEKVYAGLLQLVPDFSSATIDETIRFRKASDRDHYIEGLRKAGLQN
jgi:TolB-like protein/class 3 adenylate cyclase/Tfp pilus assembly protein PilF